MDKERTLRDRVKDVIESLVAGTSIQYAGSAVDQLMDLIEPAAAPTEAIKTIPYADEETYLINDCHSFNVVGKDNTYIANLDVVRRHGVALLTNLSVHHAHRRKGLARRLFEQAFAYYSAEDLYLNVYGFHDRPMDDALLTAFYRSLGFEPVAGAPGMMCRLGRRETFRYEVIG